MENNRFEMSYFNAPITNKVPQRTMTLEQVAELIRSDELAPQTLHLRSLTDKAEARAYKGQNFPYITPSGVFSYCNDSSLVRHSGILTIDLDGVEDVVGLMGQLTADRHFFTPMAFRSPSGKGVKWFIVIDLSKCDHRTWFLAVRSYLLESYSCLTPQMVDRQCQNPSRACFLCYDPCAYVNHHLECPELSFDPLFWAAKSEDAKKPTVKVNRQPSASQPLHPMEELAKAKAVTRELVRRGANIADSYLDYVKLGFSLANGLGSDGRELYHMLCAQSPKYSEAACEGKWNECLSKTDGRTTIATFYNMAKQAGVDLKEITRIYNGYY